MVVLVECREERFCLPGGKCEGSERHRFAEACGQAAVAVDNFAEVFHNGSRSDVCKEHRLSRECIAREWLGKEMRAVNAPPETRKEWSKESAGSKTRAAGFSRPGSL